MSTASHILPNIIKFAKANAPEILTAAGVTGVIATGYLAVKAGFKAKEIIDEDIKENGPYDYPSEARRAAVKLTWKCYVPPAVAGAVTVVAIFGSNRASGKRTAAAVAAYSLTEKAFSEYREKVTEEIGKNKEQKIRDEIVEREVQKSPPKEVFLFNDGEVLCRDELSGRYFKSNMEALRRAELNVNRKAMLERYVSVDEFYDLVGLWHTELSDNLGWTSDRLLELVFTSVITPDGQPCLCYKFNYVEPI